MADLFGNDFEQAQTTAADVDPAAEFLAQQENEIAGLESGFEDAPTEQLSVNGFSGGLQDGEANPVSSNDDFFNVGSNVENEPPMMNGGGGDYDTGDLEERMDPSQAYAAIAVADARLEQLRAEPEKIRIWREENTKLLAEKDRESERKQQEWLAQARKELEDWNRNRQEQLEKTMESNRTAEEQFIDERDQNAPGSEWERVSKLCDFNPKASKGSKDVTRMRSTLLHLKQNPRPVSVPAADGN